MALVPSEKISPSASDLLFLLKPLLHALRISPSSPELEIESHDYKACTFQLNDARIKFRFAKITPTKTGQFVTLWKRNGDGPIQPFDHSDKIDMCIIATAKENKLGQFMFPKSVLIEQGIFSINAKGGKLAIRVYPPWDKPTNKQAERTQKWQLAFFLDLSDVQKIDFQKAEFLFSSLLRGK